MVARHTNESPNTKSQHFAINFGEVVDYIIETDKSDRHRADSRGSQEG